jgi:hypothetical protein
MDGLVADFNRHATAHNLFQPDGELVNDGQDLTYEWWLSMPAFDGARKFYDDVLILAEENGVSEVNFLTGAKKNAGSYSGKVDWIQKFVSERGNGILQEFMTCPKYKKWLMAGPRRILIDDNKKVVDRWIAAGGIGILHEGDYGETLSKLRDVLAVLTTQPVPGRQNPSPGPN